MTYGIGGLRLLKFLDEFVVVFEKKLVLFFQQLNPAARSFEVANCA
jgi:hypothetical protein